jgi:hypothetical protein
MSDVVKLTIPHQRPYHGVVRLVVGGLAARSNFSLETLEDLQLAFESLLANETYVAGETVSVEVTVADHVVQMAVGPFQAERLRADLEAEPNDTNSVPLGRLLETVAGEVGIEERGDGHWVRLEKPIQGAELSSAV